MSDSDEEPQSDASDGSVYNYTSDPEHEGEYTHFPEIPRQRDAHAKTRISDLLHKLEDLIERNVT
jgi:hypothetical protein